MTDTVQTFPLRLPRSLRKAVEEYSAADGVSMNQFVAMAVAEKVSALKTAEFFAEKSTTSDKAEALKILRRSGGAAPQDGDQI